MLPKLFFIHFHQTSFVAEHDGTVVGFLAGFVSQTFPDEAYIHFIGVHHEFRKLGVARRLYDQFFATVKALNCRVVRCVTSPVNKTSIAFHRRLGFSIQPSDKNVDGIPVAENYDGRGGDRVLFFKRLDD